MAVERRVLVIDEDAAFRRYATHVLASMGFEVVEATNGRAGLAELRRWTPECIVADVSLSDITGLEILSAIASEPAPRPPTIVVSVGISVQDAVEAMRSGAADVLEKPLSAERLRMAVQEAIEHSDLAQDLGRMRGLSDAKAHIFSGQHPKMQAMLERVERLANVEMPTLLVGETGTGTLELARKLHMTGPRSEKPFIVVPSSGDAHTMCSALFGTDNRPSAFAQAEEGTVFISNLANLGSDGQQRLARVLSELSAARASGQPISCARIIVASHQDMNQEVAAGRVRDDLAHRLTPLTVTIPPLRERRSDIPEIAQRLGKEAALAMNRPAPVFGEDVLRHMAEQDWPGNCDELSTAVTRGVLLSRGGKVRLEDLIGPTSAHVAANTDAGWRPILDESGMVRRFEQYEAEIFRFALEKAGGCVSRAAENLGVGRATMYRKMRSYDIDAPPVSERAIVRTGRRRRRKVPAAANGPTPRAA